MTDKADLLARFQATLAPDTPVPAARKRIVVEPGEPAIPRVADIAPIPHDDDGINIEQLGGFPAERSKRREKRK